MKRYLVLVANVESEYIEKRKWCDNEREAMAFVDGYNEALRECDQSDYTVASWIVIDSEELSSK